MVEESKVQMTNEVSMVTALAFCTFSSLTLLHGANTRRMPVRTSANPHLPWERARKKDAARCNVLHLTGPLTAPCLKFSAILFFQATWQLVALCPMNRNAFTAHPMPSARFFTRAMTSLCRKFFLKLPDKLSFQFVSLFLITCF